MPVPGFPGAPVTEPYPCPRQVFPALRTIYLALPQCSRDLRTGVMGAGLAIVAIVGGFLSTLVVGPEGIPVLVCDPQHRRQPEHYPRRRPRRLAGRNGGDRHDGVAPGAAARRFQPRRSYWNLIRLGSAPGASLAPPRLFSPAPVSGRAPSNAFGLSSPSRRARNKSARPPNRRGPASAWPDNSRRPTRPAAAELRFKRRRVAGPGVAHLANVANNSGLRQRPSAGACALRIVLWLPGHTRLCWDQPQAAAFPPSLTAVYEAALMAALALTHLTVFAVL